MGVRVNYSGTTPEGIPFQGCYLKIWTFLADCNDPQNIVLLAKFRVYLTRDTRLQNKAYLTYTTLPTEIAVNTSASELSVYSFGIVEFLYEKLMLELLKKGFAVEQVLEPNQTAPSIPDIQTSESNENVQTNGEASLADTNALPSEP